MTTIYIYPDNSYSLDDKVFRGERLDLLKKYDIPEERAGSDDEYFEYEGKGLRIVAFCNRAKYRTVKDRQKAYGIEYRKLKPKNYAQIGRASCRERV